MRKTLICLFLACAPLHADEDTFRERFADPATRTAALADLIPGTQDAYFHTALDHQLTGRDDQFRIVMAEWKAATQRKENRISGEGMATLENRQLLMDYQKKPDASLAELIKRLNLKFDDTRPDAAAAAASLPTKVDRALISEAAFEKLAAEKSKDAPYTAYRDERRMRELERVENFDEKEVRWFLENLDRADLPGVVPLIDRSLALPRPVPFGSLTIHAKLTSGQLTALLELHPKLRASEAFALAYLEKLRPGAETDFDRDLKAHADHLSRCRDFVLTLPPALNSLKAHVLFHHLRLQMELGNFPKDDFLAFLALPRQRHELLITRENIKEAFPELDADFSKATACPPVGDDVRLIESYLNHFLSQTDSLAEFAPFVSEKLLPQIHARARLLAGENLVRWGTLLDPVEFKSLQEETRIAFAPGAPKRINADTAASLTLDLKNTPDLLIRIYEIDLPDYLANHGSEPDVSLDLDGLVPHHERRLTFAQAPLVQHRETIALPELTGSGAWLVDFVGGQVSARALIRKGSLIPFVKRTAEGQTVRLFDEKGNPVLNASIALGREKLTADASGRIVVPNTANQPITRGIIQAGKLAVPISLDSRADEIKLDAKFHLEREQLLADQEAKLHLRVRLTNHGYEIPLDRIKEPAITLKAELLGGVTTERVIAENLALKPVLELPFQVPADLLKLTLTLNGTVTSATGGDPEKLTAESTYEINDDLKLARVGTAFFSPTTDGHRLELRGRNGEPLPSRELTLEFSRFDYDPDIELRVRTDENGRVDLGKLNTIDYLNARGTDIAETLYGPRTRALDYTSRLHLPAGQEIRLPLEKPAAAPDHLQLSLIETLDEQPLRDHFDKITIADGQLVIRDLPPGDFLLTQGDSTTNIHISSGALKDGMIVSPTRIQESFSPLNPTIMTATAANGELRIKIRDSGPDTRVTLIGKRYHHEEWSSGPGLYPFMPPLPTTAMPGFIDCGYLTDRRLSDETRYILDRRAAMTFPGSMLPRPSQLLNRWTEENAGQGVVPGGAGEAGAGLGREKSGRSTGGSAPSERGDGEKSELPIVCDFLRFPAAVRFDLTPAPDGTLTVLLANFEGSQFIEVAVTDVFASDEIQVPLPPSDTPLRDRRIARPLDPKTHFLATRSAAVLQKGAEAKIENLLDADWRAFTTLTDAHQFLYGMTSDDRLREFVFLAQWPDLTEEKKLELLEKHACHELHLFLARKDKPFFEKYVKPLLSGKPEPQFMDDLLLGRDLTSYLRPYAWQRLNAAEKALLVQAVPAAKERVLRELSQRWELETPTPDAETTLFTQTLRGADLATQDSLGLARQEMKPGAGANAYIVDRLNRIIIPRIDFEDTTVEEAIDFLRLRAAELDSTELDPSKKGVGFVIRRPRADGTNIATESSETSANLAGSLRIKELHLRNVPLAVALKYICEQTKLRYKVDDVAVTLVPQTEAGEDIFTRTFRVPPDFAAGLDVEDAGDPFVEGGSPPRRLSARKPILELLKQAGITFPEGSSATLSANGTLLVSSTPSELDKIEQLTEATACISQNAPEMADGFVSNRAEGLEPNALPPIDLASAADPFDVTGSYHEEWADPPELPNSVSSFPRTPATADPFAGPSAGGVSKLAPRKPMAPHLFPERTKVWREANYYHQTKPTGESLIPLNRFWLDLAAWDGKGSFLSPHFNACHTNANEALMCLALLDLPFKAERPEVKVEGSTLRVKARESMLLFYKDTRSTDKVAPESPLLVRQSFSPQAEAFRTVNGRQVENPVIGDFRPGVAYRASLVVTNPTGQGRRIDVLAQIPAGSIPLSGRPATLSSTHELKPYGVLMLNLSFYFPAAGDFPVYPLHVSEDGTVLALTDLRTLRVSNDPVPQDAASWSVLAKEGTNEEVLGRLGTENLKTIDLPAIRWRLKDRTFFDAVWALLRERLYFSRDVSSFAFLHNDVAALRGYFENSEAARQLGQWLDSPLLDVRPRVHHDWETLEFDPLVNPRAHRFGNESRLTHEMAKAHYHAFLDQLGWKASLDVSDEMTLTAFLFLQDRIGDALARFDKIDPAKLPGRLNYDYLHAVALFYREKPEEARAIAAKVLPTLPPGLWHERFTAVDEQAAEIAGLNEPGDPGEKDSPAKEPAAPQLGLALAADGKLVIQHQALEKASLRLFSVDLEVLFSKDPFLSGDGGGLPAIRPNEILEVPLAKDKRETVVELPEGLRKGNVLVSAESGTKKLLKILDSRALEIHHRPEERTIQVINAAASRPLAKTYVKVYAEMRSGEVVFHKDGYTDLRGKFDYISHTGVDVSSIKRFAVLVSDKEKGARTVIYDR